MLLRRQSVARKVRSVSVRARDSSAGKFAAKQAIEQLFNKLNNFVL